MDEATPPPVPAPPGTEPPAPLTAFEAPDAQIPLATVATARVSPPDIPFAHADAPPQYRYTTSVAQRPGLVTAIGVLAIVIACLSGIVSVIGGGQAFVFYMLSKTMAQIGNMNLNPTQQPQNAAPAVDTNPMSIADSGMVTTVMQDQLALDGARLREFTELLHKHGSAIFHTDDNATLTTAAVKDAITELHKAPDSDSAARFSTAQGTVEIYPDRAAFTSTDGTATIHTSAKDHSESVVLSAATVANAATMPAYTLQPGEISRAIAQIRQQAGVTVTPAQIATIRRELSSPNQTYVTNANGNFQSVYYAANLPNNDLQIYFNNGTLQIDAAGKIVSWVANNPQFGQFGAIGPQWTPPGRWVAVVVSECAAAGLLAIYLFITGIITLRGSLHSPRLLRIYAVPKILLAMVGGFGVAALIMQSSVNNASTMNAGNELAGCLLGAGVFLAGVAYPIGVLLALRHASVRQYFSASEANRF